jgi:hypothetical protein
MKCRKRLGGHAQVLPFTFTFADGWNMQAVTAHRASFAWSTRFKSAGGRDIGSSSFVVVRRKGSLLQTEAVSIRFESVALVLCFATAVFRSDGRSGRGGTTRSSSLKVFEVHTIALTMTRDKGAMKHSGYCFNHVRDPEIRNPSERHKRSHSDDTRGLAKVPLVPLLINPRVFVL